MLATARELLLADGFAEFSVPRVAAAAGVSSELVHKAVGGRAALLATLLDVAVGATTSRSPSPTARRCWPCGP